MKARLVFSYVAWVAGVTLAYLLATPDPVAADNCQNFTDCFSTADAATDSLLGMSFLAMLSMGLDFIPYVGTAKGVAEAITGRDLLTGEELSDAERLLGLIPGGLGKAGDLVDGLRHADELVGGLRHGDELVGAGLAAGRHSDDAAGLARHTDDVPTRPPAAPPPRDTGGTGGSGSPPPPRSRPGGAGPDDTLARQGTSWESASRLQRQSEAAEANGFGHGVSVTTPESNARLSRNPADASSATRREFEEAGFPVHHTPTARDPNHHTVELPDPVTPEDARRFNEILGRTRR